MVGYVLYSCYTRVILDRMGFEIYVLACVTVYYPTSVIYMMIVFRSFVSPAVINIDNFLHQIGNSHRCRKIPADYLFYYVR